MKLWLDATRDPVRFGFFGWIWARSAEEAIALLATGQIRRASLERDLTWEHSQNSGKHPWEYREKSGEDVLAWMVANDTWPPKGVRIHAQNPESRARMEEVVRQHYGRNF